MIRVGVGGWTYEPWRGTFYPDGLAQKRELEFAAGRLTAIEINGTFYGSQKPESFRRWAAETPDDFVFTVKGPRFATYRRVLAEAGESVARFFSSGVRELKTKLGPVLWQLPPTKKFEAADFAAFLALLPREGLRHAIEVRHETFRVAECVGLARAAGVAIVFADSEKYPAIADPTADFIYARLQRAAADVPTGYAVPALKAWAERVQAWEEGGAPGDLEMLAGRPPKKRRDVFVFMINGAKERAPAAALKLIELLK